MKDPHHHLNSNIGVVHPVPRLQASDRKKQHAQERQLLQFHPPRVGPKAWENSPLFDWVSERASDLHQVEVEMRLPTTPRPGLVLAIHKPFNGPLLKQYQPLVKASKASRSDGYSWKAVCCTNDYKRHEEAVHTMFEDLGADEEMPIGAMQLNPDFPNATHMTTALDSLKPQEPFLYLVLSEVLHKLYLGSSQEAAMAAANAHKLLPMPIVTLETLRANIGNHGHRLAKEEPTKLAAISAQPPQRSTLQPGHLVDMTQDDDDSSGALMVKTEDRREPPCTHPPPEAMTETSHHKAYSQAAEHLSSLGPNERHSYLSQQTKEYLNALGSWAHATKNLDVVQDLDEYWEASSVQSEAASLMSQWIALPAREQPHFLSGLTPEQLLLLCDLVDPDALAHTSLYQMLLYNRASYHTAFAIPDDADELVQTLNALTKVDQEIIYRQLSPEQMSGLQERMDKAKGNAVAVQAGLNSFRRRQMLPAEALIEQANAFRSAPALMTIQ